MTAPCRCRAFSPALAAQGKVGKRVRCGCRHGDALEYADESLTRDKEVALAAVTQRGVVLRDVDESFKRDKDVVLGAVQNDCLALYYVDKSLKGDKDVAFAASTKL